MPIFIVCYTQTCLIKKIKHFITILEVHKLILVYFIEEIDHTCIYGLMKSHKVFLIITSFSMNMTLRCICRLSFEFIYNLVLHVNECYSSYNHGNSLLYKCKIFCLYMLRLVI